jgi:hypothetical protein
MDCYWRTYEDGGIWWTLARNGERMARNTITVADEFSTNERSATIINAPSWCGSLLGKAVEPEQPWLILQSPPPPIKIGA